MASLSPIRLSFLLLLPFLFISPARCQFPIPPRYDGFSLTRTPTPTPLLLEAFFDLMCPSCRQAWPIISDVIKRYDKNVLQLIIHPFPVPFHHSANIAARGMHIASKINSSLSYDWMEAVYRHQNELSDYYTKNLSYEKVVEKFSELGTEIGVEKSKFLEGFEDSDTDYLTRVSFKFGCSRAVVGTPTFSVNGVTVLGADENWSVQDWINLLDPLVGTRSSVEEL